MEIGIDLPTLKDCTVLGACWDVQVDGLLQLTLVDGGAWVGDLLVPFLVGILSVAFSFPFLVPMPKEEEKERVWNIEKSDRKGGNSKW